MKTEISDEVYLVSAAPITHVFWNGCYNTGNVVDYFLATPIIGKPLIGKKRTVAYVELISKEPICNTDYECGFDGGFSYDDPTTQVQIDAASNSTKVGDVAWVVDAKTTADRLLKKEVIEEYLKQSPEALKQRINEVRKYCSELTKADSFENALNR